MRFRHGLLTERELRPRCSLKSFRTERARMASLLRVADKKDAKLRVNGPVSYQVEEVSLQGVRPVATQRDSEVG